MNAVLKYFIRSIFNCKKIALGAGLSFLFSNIVWSQDISVMKKQLQQKQADTAQISILNKIAGIAYFNNEYDSCKKYALMALQLSDKLLNTPSVINKAAYLLQCKKLKAKSLENYGSSLTFENAKLAEETLLNALQRWKETKDETGLASVYQRIAEIFMNKNKSEVALKYFDSSLALYKKLNLKTGLAYAYYEKALTERYISRFGDALESNLLAMNLAAEIKDSALELQCMLANGFIYMLVKDIPKALEIQNEALQIATRMNSQDFISTVYSDIGVTNMRAGKLDVALQNHLKALDIRKKYKQLYYLSSTYNYISEILMTQAKYREALKYNLEGLAIAKSQGLNTYLLDAYYYTALNYSNLQEYKKSLLYYDSLLQVSARMNDAFHLSMSYQGFANIYSLMNETSRSIDWLQKALVKTDSADYRNLFRIYSSLSSAYYKTGNYKDAYESQLKLKRYDDSLKSIEKTDKLKSLTIQLEFKNRQTLMKASQDKQLAIKQTQIERQKLIKNISIISLIAVIGLAFMFFIRFKEKQRLNLKLENTLLDLRSAQAQLVHSEKMASLGVLTAGISHEIQNPLNFVKNFSEVNKDLLEEMMTEIDKGNIEEVKAIAKDVIENSDKIMNHGQRAGAIVKGMLQHSRNSTGQKEPTDINALCDEYLRLSYHGLRAKDGRNPMQKPFNARFETNLDDSIGKINIVAQDISRVILNLINNAFYAVHEKAKTNIEGYEPTVTVSTKKMVNKIMISIKDNGNGIPPAIKDKIFQPFFTTKPSGSGTGLGLSLSYDIIKAHGGEISLETKEQVGTEFKIQLPLT